MRSKNKFLYLSIPIVVSIGAVVILFNLQRLRQSSEAGQQVNQEVLGETLDSKSNPSNASNQTHFDSLTGPKTEKIPVPTRSAQNSAVQQPPLPLVHSVEIADAPSVLTEGGIATFTWQVIGPTKTIHTTAVYYGVTSFPNVPGFDTTPQDTHYSDWLKDFIDGDYLIPMRFISSVQLGVAGTYYFRAYALIDGKNYWSPEKTFVVKPEAKHEIKIVNYPTTVSSGGNATFTWDIYGPASTTGFTTIVGGKVSKPETLNISVEIPQTPYAVLVNDFVSGTYNVPLRFVGNTAPLDAGVYYFRALAFINGKNIWSPEYTFTVE